MNWPAHTTVPGLSFHLELLGLGPHPALSNPSQKPAPAHPALLVTITTRPPKPTRPDRSPRPIHPLSPHNLSQEGTLSPNSHPLLEFLRLAQTPTRG